MLRPDLRNIEYMAPVDDIREFYRRVRLMLMPSHNEDAGTIPQEAGANGIPCISTGVGGLRETNAAGIILPLHAEPEYQAEIDEDIRTWKSTIESLDDPQAYEKACLRQHAGLPAFQWKEKFDILNQRIVELSVRNS